MRTSSKIQALIKTKWCLYHSFSKSVIYVALLSILILLLATKGIRDEGTVSLDGDMPRYLMNGVYLYDLIRDFPLTNIFNYTYQYFARYPALSLGHHPLLLSIAEAPFYAIFGISICSGRLTIVFFMLLASIVWFLLIRSIYDENIAFFSSLLFVTTPFIVRYSQIVLSEIPTLALIILTTYFFYQYCQFNKSKYLYAFAVCLVLSVYAKQLAILMVPVFFCYFIITKGPRKLIVKEMVISCLIIILLLVPFILITLRFSPANVAWVIDRDLSSRVELSNLLYYLKVLWQYHLTLPVLILSVITICISVFRRDKRTIIFLLWIASYYLQITFLGAQAPRYAIYWIPPFCLLAANIFDFFRNRTWKVLLSSLLILIAVYQFAVAFKSDLIYARGYEEAARFVVEHQKGESVLFNSNVDTGYFIFFVRKHNPDRDLIVLRADKILATSWIDCIVEERINNREEIYEILRDFGTGYVVIEDKKFASPPLKWLREEVKSNNFILRKKIQISTNSFSLQDVALRIYEYKGYTPPKYGKKLNMNLPIINDSINVQFDDLLHDK